MTINASGEKMSVLTCAFLSSVPDYFLPAWPFIICREGMLASLSQELVAASGIVVAATFTVLLGHLALSLFRILNLKMTERFPDTNLPDESEAPMMS